MSWKIMRWAMPQWIEDAPGSKVSASAAKFVLVVLADAADEQGVSFLSHGTIAKRTQLSRQSVVWAIARLETQGLIQRTTRHRETDGGRTSDLVALNIARGAGDAPREEAQLAPDAGRADVIEARAHADPPDTTTTHPPVKDFDTPCQDLRHPLPKILTPITNQLTDQITERDSPLPPGIHAGLLIKKPQGQGDQSPEGPFDEFWAIYPRKVAKPAARRAYVSSLKRTSHDRIMRGARDYAEARQGQDPKYTAHPATWLNGDRWNDEPAPTSPNHRAATGWSGFDQAIAGLSWGDDDNGGMA